MALLRGNDLKAFLFLQSAFFRFFRRYFIVKYSSFASSEVKGVITPYGRSGS